MLRLLGARRKSAGDCESRGTQGRPFRGGCAAVVQGRVHRGGRREGRVVEGLLDYLSHPGPAAGLIILARSPAPAVSNGVAPPPARRRRPRMTSKSLPPHPSIALASAASAPIGRRAFGLGLGAGVAVCLAGPLAGCASKAPKPSKVSGSIQANVQLNPSVSNRPSPVLLRVYELKSATVFNSADFMALFQGDQATLAGDLVSREEMMLQPGEQRPYNKTLAPETRFIAVMAAYRNLERATWRQSVPVLLGREQAVLIRADTLAVSVTVQAK